MQNSFSGAKSNLTTLQNAQQVNDSEALKQYAGVQASGGGGSGGGGYDITQSKQAALSGVGGASAGNVSTSDGSAVAGSNVNPGVVAVANQMTGGSNMRTNRFQMPDAKNLNFGGA